MGAPTGNTNSSADNRLWGNTIRRLAVQDPERMRRIAEKLLTMAEGGDIQAMKELGDRTDGKAVQTIAGDPENPLQTSLTVEFVGAVPGEASPPI